MRETLLSIVYMLLVGACSDKTEDLLISTKQEIGLSSEEAACLMRLQLKNEYSSNPLNVLAENKALEAISVFDQPKHTRSCSERKVKDIVPITTGHTGCLKSALADTTAYVVNFANNNGFVVLSADWRTDQVLAIVERGNLDINNKESYPPQMEVFFGNMKTMLEEQRANAEAEDAIYLETALMKLHIKTKTNTLKVAGDTHTQLMYYDAPEVYYTEPLVLTQWNQVGEPYDIYAELIDNKRAPMGCTTTAIAQIMSCHKYPTSYHWDELIKIKYPYNNPSYNTEIGHLLKAVADGIHVKWGLEGTSAPISRACSYLKSIGYSNGGTEDAYSFSHVQNSIENGSPVLMCGDDGETGHAWVVDRVFTKKRIAHFYDWVEGVGPTRFYTTYDYPDRYIYCNWGWGGSHDGYFFDGAFDANKNGEKLSTLKSATSYNYKYHLSAVYNIKR